MPPSSQGVCWESEGRPHFLNTPPDVRLAIFAAEHEGVVSTRQLHDLGLNNSAIRVRVRNGHLHRIHHGVYAVGTPRSR